MDEVDSSLISHEDWTEQKTLHWSMPSKHKFHLVKVEVEEEQIIEEEEEAHIEVEEAAF